MPVIVGSRRWWRRLNAAFHRTSHRADVSHEHWDPQDTVLDLGALQHAILGSATFSIIATDAKGIIQIFNAGAERMLGYAAAEVVNLMSPTDLHEPEAVIARASGLSREFAFPIAPGPEALVFKAARGIEDIYEAINVRKDGSRFPAILSVTALRDTQDAIIGYLLIASDNTARKHVEEARMVAEEARRTSEARYRTLFDCAPDGIVIADPESRYLDANGAMCRMLGYTHDELTAFHASDIVVEAEVEHIEPALTMIKAGTEYHREWRFRRKDGSIFDAEVIVTTMPDDNLLGMIRDITDRKRGAETLLQKNLELEAASRLKSEFLANMSHELRTPLNSIIGFSEVLRDGLIGAISDEQRGFIGHILGSGIHLLSLINEILDLSKVEAGKMTLDLEPVEMSALLANSISVLKESATRNLIRLELDAPVDLGATLADVRKFKQIVFNLLANAVKFTSAGGCVTLCARCVPRAAVGRPLGSWTARTFALPDNEFTAFLEIGITDDGIGISPEGLEQLFQPFSQIDRGLARRFEGTGLGLAMVKLLVELHGGALAVQSAVGVGSRFTVWLPLREPKPGVFTPSKALASTPRIEALTRGRVALVVEDDCASANLIRMQLEAEGFEVLHAASGEAGLLLAAQWPVAFVTLAIQLPNMDGWEFLRRIKQVPELCHIPVVIISIVSDRTKGLALGAAAVMEKPISRQQLYEVLSHLGMFPLSHGQTLRVLVVDDDPMVVELIALRIAAVAKTVLRAYGGRQAIEVAQRERPDVIVLDLMMPEVSGFDVVQALKEDPVTAGIPILIVTAAEMDAENRAKLSASVAMIVEKSDLDAERATAEIRRAIAGRHGVA